jgi:hypothetical protein
MITEYKNLAKSLSLQEIKNKRGEILVYQSN